jgi:penicillin-binding protein 2
MARRITLKDHLRETHLYSTRVIVAAVVIALLVSGLLAQLFYLQVVRHEHFITQSKNNRVRIVPIAPSRGLIYDRNGVLLAENLPSFTLEIIPEKVQDMEQTLQRLGSLIQLEAADIDRFYKELKKKRRFEAIPLRYRLNDEEVARFSVNRHQFEGVAIQARLIRYYPLGKLTAHVIGYVGRINERELQKIDTSNYSATTHIGKTGVEGSYEKQLHGIVGYQQVETNAQGRLLRVLDRTSPIPGQNLTLAIDARLQAEAYRLLEGEKGAAVAIDPNTGEVLLFASSPVFDANLFVTGIDPETYNQLSTSPRKPLFNRALRGSYPPGSTIKPFIGLAGLDYRVINHKHTVFCPGWYQLKNDERKYRDWKKQGHGFMDMNGAITQSCDVYFYDLALQLGIDKMHQFLGQFGLGKLTGIDILGESSGLLPSREWKRRERRLPWFPGETLITGIGQGFTLTTPLQLAYATAVLSTRGKRFQPRVVSALEDPISHDSHANTTEPEPALQLKAGYEWDQIHKAMFDVVHGARGTARRIGQNAPYHIAGKTGTAQVFGIAQEEEYEEDKVKKHLRDHSLFVAFAPAEDPRIAIAVVVENGGSGSAVAAPMARKLMDRYLVEEQ